MFDVIVIPTDGSEFAENAAERGFELARHHDSTVHVLCVADTGMLGDLRLPGDDASADDAIRAKAREFVDRLADRARAGGLDVTTAVPDGTAKNAIIDYAESVDADAIVMGTSGRGGVERLVLGSVAGHVVRHSDVDVLVTHGTGK
ncbi:universal stress protein [Natronomonas salina]|uniref:universal stress protein n=1 Tax=Natronomonas salina TaxID=1710540 RepID=UPI0015B4F3AF|nr:universal stress protein [Natronomonas salina]QLD90992.1 universal stress protein [Natronomonas salina]